MSDQTRPTLESTLQMVRDAYAGVLRTSGPEELRATEDELLGRLGAQLPLEEDGGIVLQDGSRLYIGPERGDRGEETGKIGVVQRFPDGSPERVHLITP